MYRSYSRPLAVLAILVLMCTASFADNHHDSVTFDSKPVEESEGYSWKSYALWGGSLVAVYYWRAQVPSILGGMLNGLGKVLTKYHDAD